MNTEYTYIIWIIYIKWIWTKHDKGDKHQIISEKSETISKNNQMLQNPLYTLPSKLNIKYQKINLLHRIKVLGSEIYRLFLILLIKQIEIVECIHFRLIVYVLFYILSP